MATVRWAIPHFPATPSYACSIAYAEIGYESEPEHTDEALIAELRTAKIEYLHAAVDALAAVELWLALDAWIPEDHATHHAA